MGDTVARIALKSCGLAREAIQQMERRLIALSLKGDAHAFLEAERLRRLLKETDDATARHRVIALLAARGVISREEERAADHIRLLIEAWTRGGTSS